MAKACSLHIQSMKKPRRNMCKVWSQHYKVQSSRIKFGRGLENRTGAQITGRFWYYNNHRGRSANMYKKTGRLTGKSEWGCRAMIRLSHSTVLSRRSERARERGQVRGSDGLAGRETVSRALQVCALIGAKVNQSRGGGVINLIN